MHEARTEPGSSRTIRPTGRIGWGLLWLCPLWLYAPAAAGPVSPPDPAWLYGVAAAYEMLIATGSRSSAPGDGYTSVRSAAGGSWSSPTAARLASSPSARSYVAQIARQYEIRGITPADRRRLDENLWAYTQRATPADFEHLGRQWAIEDRVADRAVAANVRHAERCAVCRTAYRAITRETTLTCGSRRIGFRPPKTKRERKRNQGSTIPP